MIYHFMALGTIFCLMGPVVCVIIRIIRWAYYHDVRDQPDLTARAYDRSIYYIPMGIFTLGSIFWLLALFLMTLPAYSTGIYPELWSFFSGFLPKVGLAVGFSTMITVGLVAISASDLPEGARKLNEDLLDAIYPPSSSRLQRVFSIAAIVFVASGIVLLRN